MAAAGAFGTEFEPPLLRFAYWIGLMVLGTPIARVVYAGMNHMPPIRDRAIAQLVAGTLVMAVVYTGVVWAVSSRLAAGQPRPGIASYFLPVLIVSAAMTALNLLAGRRPLETHAGAAGSPPPRFLDRMPPKLRGAALHAVEAEDHYLRLHTDRGSDLILMRLADAVAELEGLEGAQTHRSWWVAKQAVESARRENGRAVLRLKSGVEAPVSRTYVKALRDEGWL